MKRLSLLTSIIFIMISNCYFSYASTNLSGGTITFLGSIYEPQCKINITEKKVVSIKCYRNGKNIIKNFPLENFNKISSTVVNANYYRYNKKTNLKIKYK